jgi:hypothetical protein
MQVGGLPRRDVVTMVGIIAVLSVTILWPLDYLWWSLLGWAR